MTNQNMKIFIAVAIIILITAAYFLLSYSSKNQAPKDETLKNQITENKIPAPAKTEVKELQITDIVVGTGTEAKNGDMVKVHYTGTFESGEKFDSSRDRGTPIEFQLGSGMVIKGWDTGIEGMKVGGKRKLKIPGNLAYGEQGRPGHIPPNATLLFDVELVGVAAGK